MTMPEPKPNATEAETAGSISEQERDSLVMDVLRQNTDKDLKELRKVATEAAQQPLEKLLKDPDWRPPPRTQSRPWLADPRLTDRKEMCHFYTWHRRAYGQGFVTYLAEALTAFIEKDTGKVSRSKVLSSQVKACVLALLDGGNSPAKPKRTRKKGAGMPPNEAVPPPKPRRDRSGYERPDRKKTVGLYVNVTADVRDDFKRLAEALGISTIELHRKIIKAAIARGKARKVSTAEARRSEAMAVVLGDKLTLP
jgi:hypothetical protein